MGISSDTRQYYLMLCLIKRVVLGDVLVLQVRNVTAPPDLRGVEVELVRTRHHIDYLSLVEQGLHLILRVRRYRLRTRTDMPLEYLARSQLLLFYVLLRIIESDISYTPSSLSNKLLKK